MIEAIGITKYYGDFPAVTGLNFSVELGEILGFLGPNGAGKSTTMKILTGFIPPSSGTAKIAGYDIVEQSLLARRHIGYLPETVPLYEDMGVSDYLSFMGQIRGMNRKWIDKRLAEVIDVVKLGDYQNTLIGRLVSKTVNNTNRIFVNFTDRKCMKSKTIEIKSLL